MNNDSLPAIGAAGAPPHLPGLDEEGQEYFCRAWACVYPFLRDALGADESWADLPNAQTRSTLLQRFTQLERNVTRSGAALRAVRERGLEKYREDYLLKIAEPLGFVSKCRATALRSLIRRGLLVLPQTIKDPLSVSALASVETWLASIMDEHKTAKQQRALLVQEGACRSERVAGDVVDALAKVNVQAAAMARGLILAAIEHGWVGLLHHSNHPCIEPLLLLQRHAHHIAELTPSSGEALRELRADLVALHKALSSSVSSNRKSLWHFNLLHLPAKSPQRTAFRQHLSPSVQDALIARLGDNRACSYGHASCLLEIFLQGGLTALIDWRCGHTGPSSEQNLTIKRVEAVTRQTLAPLNPAAQRRAADLLRHLHDASQEAGIPVPIIMLVSQHPSSIYRRRLGRRIWFGVGASVSRRQRRYRRKGKRRWLQEQSRRPELSEGEPSPDDLLVSSFVARSGLKDEQEGRTLIRNLITYGGIGLFRRSEWRELFDPRLISFLSFFKLGYPDGALNWQSMMSRLRAYAHEQGLVAPSSQLAKALFNSIPKPRNWHGGYGEDVATVRQRATLVLGAPRLHESWVVLQTPQRLPVVLVNEQGHVLSRSATVLLIFDERIERPVGLWVDGEPEPGLALHQALWHPGQPDWPLRGIPSVIKIPKTLLKQRQRDFEQATDWMLSELQVLNPVQHTRQREKMAQAADLMHRLVLDGTKFLRKILGKRPVTRHEAVVGLFDWLTTGGEGGGQCFPKHRTPELPPGSITYGQAILPGYDLPVAGRLLPILGQTQTQRDQVVYRGKAYAAHGFKVEPGLSVSLRGLPFSYGGAPEHLFVEDASGRLCCLNICKPLV